jgi:hypothetical protein
MFGVSGYGAAMHSCSQLISIQLGLLVYHQVTTLVDLYPFNGARNYSSREKLAEAGVNAVLMGLPVIGFAFGVRPLMWFGVAYYPVLFLIELIIWWVPYFTEPRDAWRRLYNGLLAAGTSNFEPGDTLSHWLAIHERIHAGTITVLPRRSRRIVPNLEHMILHAWTLITAVATVVVFVGLGN